MIRIFYKKKKKIIQMQLDDYIGRPRVETYEMWDPNSYQRARKRFKKWLRVRGYRRRNRIAKKASTSRQASLDEFTANPKLQSLPKPAYFKRFKSLGVQSYENHAAGVISPNEWFLLVNLPKFKGYFDHLFDFNDFSFFDDVQEVLGKEGITFKGVFLHDVIAFELLRLQLGFKDYSGLEKVSQFLSGNPLESILRDPKFFPTANVVSHVMTRIPSFYIKKFHEMLVVEEIELGIIEPRILVWDTQFIRSNCHNNPDKKTEKYSDPDAGYGRHNGKKLGVGYSCSNLIAYCGSWKRSFVVYYDIFPANRNDNPIFRATLSRFMKRGIGIWKAAIGDTGAYSIKSMDLCVRKGLHPIIRAKKNLVNFPIEEGRKGYWFNTDYFPPGWSVDDVMAMYTRRPVVEETQSTNNTFYNSKRMNGRGIENAIRGRGLNYILDAAKNITAFKLGRLDLLNTPTAISFGRDFMNRGVLPKLAIDSGYEIFESFLPYKVSKSLLDKQWKK